jgi:hypothetical protein
MTVASTPFTVRVLSGRAGVVVSVSIPLGAEVFAVSVTDVVMG